MTRTIIAIPASRGIARKNGKRRRMSTNLGLRGRAILADSAAYSDYASLKVRIRNDAAVGNNRLPQCGAIDFAPGQKARMRVNRRARLEEAVFRHDVG